MFKYKNIGLTNLFITTSSGLRCIKPSEEFNSNKILNCKFLIDVSNKYEKDIKKQVKLKEGIGEKI